MQSHDRLEYGKDSFVIVFVDEIWMDLVCVCRGNMGDSMFLL